MLQHFTKYVILCVEGKMKKRREKEMIQPTQVSVNIREKADLIWNIADHLRNLYKPHEYGEIILPLTVIKRFNDCLVETKAAVLEKNKQFDEAGILMKEAGLMATSGYNFYNISPFTFENLLDDPENIESNFRLFLGGFSENAQDVIENFEFLHQIDKMAKSGVLYNVLKSFNSERGYFGPDKISSVDMGYVFEELVRKFSESYGEEAGAHFTARDIVYLMTDILVMDESLNQMDEDDIKTIYDMTMGTSQMLVCMEERLKQLDADLETDSYGQEINPKTFAIAKADMIIKGGNANNMKCGNTLSNDLFSGYEFDYIISNPPFGVKWENEKQAVMDEHNRGFSGRFAIGVPNIDDGQMLFLLNGLSKLKETGRMAIIHNASPLFNGDAESGQSEIRRHLLENDYLEAIIQLPKDLFYNTDISTYIWVVSKNKSMERKGRVQLVDASQAFEKLRSSIGKKRVELTSDVRSLIVQAYSKLVDTVEENEMVKVKTKWFNNEEFGFHQVTVERPLRLKCQVTPEGIEALQQETTFINLATSKKKGEAGEKEMEAGREKQALLLQALAQASTDVFMNRESFKEYLTMLFHEVGYKPNAPIWKSLVKVFGTRCEEAAICYDNKGNVEPDSELRDTEQIPLTETIEDYMAREVLPYTSDAWIDETKTKIGYEIPFTRHFYEYTPPRPSREVLEGIMAMEESLMQGLKELLGDE